MNRISINLLCVIFIAVLACSILVPGLAMFNAFSSGLEAGFAQEAPNGDIIGVEGGIPVEVLFSSPGSPHVAIRDTVTIDEGHSLPIEVRRAVVRVPVAHYSTGILFTVAASYLLVAAIFIFLMIQLIRFTMKINKGIIFDRRNAAHLTKIGYSLLAIALLQIIPGVCEDYAVSAMNVSFHGVGLTSFWTIPWTEFLLAIMSLLMARIWTRGIRLKEDQELTI